MFAQGIAPTIKASSCEKPEYPSSSKRLEEEGTVQLKFLVGADGKVIESAVEKSSGFRRLDEAARQSLSKCTFKPGTKDGVDVQSWASMKYTWRLGLVSELPTCQGSQPRLWNNCYGTIKSSIGYEYVGDFLDGKRHGQGAYEYLNGDRYVGQFKDDKFNGQGTFSFSIGDVYEGEFKDGNINGLGTLKFASGNKYVGQLKDGKRSGLGTLYSSNGAVAQDGIWADDKYISSTPIQQSSVSSQSTDSSSIHPNKVQSNLHACPASGVFQNCFGTYTFPSGEKYVGEFVNNLRHGKGTFYTSSGLVVSEGIWADGRFIRSTPVQQAIAPSAQTNSAERDRLAAEVEAERKKSQEIEQQLVAVKERERITSELDLERKKRQELEAQLAASVKPSPPQTSAPRRIAHALVIGNGAYPGSGRLENPVNDANAISQKLRSMGFTVTTVTDANRQRLVQSMTQFRRTASSADISLLYYAGHGVQIFGTNYILPTDVDQTDPAQATIQGVSLNSVVENFLPGKTKLVFLDACRDNALQRTNDRSVSKGLAPISAAEGTLISYATKDGQTAADGVGSKNSPFTQALLEHLNDPQDIAVVLRKIRERVMKITGGKQQPWEYGSLTGGELVLSAIKPK